MASCSAQGCLSGVYEFGRTMFKRAAQRHNTTTHQRRTILGVSRLRCGLMRGFICSNLTGNLDSCDLEL